VKMTSPKKFRLCTQAVATRGSNHVCRFGGKTSYGWTLMEPIYNSVVLVSFKSYYYSYYFVIIVIYYYY